jgi:hypothetical protein
VNANPALDGGVTGVLDAQTGDASFTLDSGPALADAAEQGDAQEAGPATLLATDDNIVLWGVTNDGYAIYSAWGSAFTTYAVAVDGGSPIPIVTSPFGADFVAFVEQDVVFVGPIEFDAPGPVFVWSAGAGAHLLSNLSSVEYAAASDDSAHIVYADYTTVTDGGIPAAASYYVANVDGSGATLLQSTGPTQGVSDVSAGFSGSYVVITNAATAGNNYAWTLTSYAAPSWEPVTLTPNVSIVAGSDNDLLVRPVAQTQGLELVPLDGTPATNLDPNATSALFASNGDVVYTTSTGELWRVSPTNPGSPQQLVPSGIAGLLALSPDGLTALVYENWDRTTGLTDLYVASALVPGPLRPIATSMVAVPNGAYFLQAGYGDYLQVGDNFTNDSSRVVFWTGENAAINLIGQGPVYPGTLETSLASGSGAPTSWGSGSTSAWAVGSTGMVFADNLSSPDGGDSLATFDLEWVDTKGSGPPTRLVEGAVWSTGGDVPWDTAPAQNRVVFVAQPPGSAGDAGSTLSLYAAPVP